MADILSLADYVMRQGDIGRQQGKQNRLASLMGQAYSAPREQRSALIGQMVATDPQAGMGAQKAFDGMDESARSELGRYASVFDSLPDEQKPAAYGQLAQQAKSLGLPVPDEYRPEYAPHIQKIAQAFGGGAANANTVQSRFVGEDGQVYALMRDGQVSPLGIKADPNMQIIEGAGGFYGVNRRNLQANPVQVGQPGVQSQQPVQRAPGEVPFSIDPSLPPEVQASIRANESKWANSPEVNVGGDLSHIPRLSTFTGGGQLKPAPKATAQSELDRRIDTARQLGATDEEIKRMVVGGNSGRDAQRISTADATKARQKMTQIQSARQQLNAVKQAFGKLKGSFSAGIGGNYLPTPEGQAFDRAIRNLSPLITAVTRVPGVGAMSDYEAKLQEASLPSRGTYEAVTEQQIADLERLLDTIEGGYGDLLGDGKQKQSAPANDIDALLEQYK